MNRAQGPGVPEGYKSVSPWVISRDTNTVIEFAKAAFGADEIGRVDDENGVIGHAAFRIGDSVVLAFDAKPHWPDTLSLPAPLRVGRGRAVRRPGRRPAERNRGGGIT